MYPPADYVVSAKYVAALVRALLGEPHGDLRPRVQPKLVQQVVHVRFYCARRKKQARGDVLVTQALGDEQPDLLFAGAQNGRLDLGRCLSGLKSVSSPSAYATASS